MYIFCMLYYMGTLNRFFPQMSLSDFAFRLLLRPTYTVLVASKFQAKESPPINVTFETRAGRVHTQNLQILFLRQAVAKI